MHPLIPYITSALAGAVPPEELCDTAFAVAEQVSGLDRTRLLLADALSGDKITNNYPNLEILLRRLRRGEPLQYVLGSVEWGGLTLRVTPDTLIPRPETWGLIPLVEAAVNSSSSSSFDTSPASPLRVLDVCTGSGCIAIALKHRHPRWQVSACDVSEPALAVARQNAEANRTDVRFFRCDVLAESLPEADIIVSNPPYVMEREKASMQERVLRFEPALALFVPDADPLRFYRAIASQHAAPALFFEISQLQGSATLSLLRSLGFPNPVLSRDIYDNNRYITAISPSSSPHFSRIFLSSSMQERAGD
ncbi:MAG: peptide chain release factor N(5)-glutamine methyltransferase [Paludibacteraceae bacterium]|nr:peptide chain release factor N(5)-glutamine methyltransferase [Paludibacteraceae bacterium]